MKRKQQKNTHENDTHKKNKGAEKGKRLKNKMKKEGKK